ncbi:ATP-dependent DNA helicase RecG [Peptoclostridium litorale DSM 5388]|uniref:ATP-dependent DNA helicase RecG n=1 Tax=Peptoclostridium litorale DSM 5388 TaxID=1121324 RepID=A0A069RB82_PEPLI|nr:ATP-dependent DNA helicase RecG [Peptoclostridium litorale]KDR94043.1 ATP-dependent DNA helicase RecG [Peptoclostridium litorale DSM 5388]SIN80062.1 ATP-dependent DNA helicase RecG [Peptoclostridium litorale DSM 5388]
MSIYDPILTIKGIGPKKAKYFNQMGIFSIKDLLYYFPRAYEDRSKIKNISSMAEGEKAYIRAVIKKIENKKVKHGLRMSKVLIYDGQESIYAVFFNKNHMVKTFSKGQEVLVYGKLSKKGVYTQIDGYEMYRASEAGGNQKIGAVVPVYPLSGKISNTDIYASVKRAFEMVSSELEKDHIPASILKEEGLCPLNTALENIHFPRDKKSLRQSMYRMVFEEFFIMQCRLRLNERNNLAKKSCVVKKEEKIYELIDSLPFKLTKAQVKAIDEIMGEMALGMPMNRLLQGDVGCGKTIIAAICMANCAFGGYQSLMMVPTEVVAQQHYNSISATLEKFGVKTALLTGNTKKDTREDIYSRMKSGDIDILVGTHALIQEGLECENVALVITDEQHRFGVSQRNMLSKKGNSPHALYMSATPIPRSLAITMYADMDMTVVDELPSGRKKVITSIITGEKRKQLYDSLMEKVKSGVQAYIVCPLVEESDSLSLNSAVETYEKLKRLWKGSVKVGLLHGRLSSEEKEDTIRDFKSAKIDVLVCTTVVEVGVDAPNASIIIIENAERFGLSQLHQLRGRVGRGSIQSYCVLVCESCSGESIKRLNVIKQSCNGFEIAQKDLEIRGPGEFAGHRQHGMLNFRIADISRHPDILEKAKKQVDKLIEEGIRLESDGNSLLKNIIVKNGNTDIC